MPDTSPPATPLRRRPMLAVPSWILGICLVLPALRVCGNPTTPLEFPPSYVIYVGAVIVGLIAWSRRARVRQLAMTTLVALWGVVVGVIATAVIGDVDLSLGAVAAIGTIVGLVVIIRALARTAPGDRTILIVCLAHAVTATLWNAALAFDPEGMWGAVVALGASLTMVAAATAPLVSAWIVTARRRRASRPVPLPLARIVID